MFSYTRAMADVCPTEDAVEALLEYLVDPLLPVKSLLRETPSQSQQQSIAKQVFLLHLISLIFFHWPILIILIVLIFT